MLSESVSDWIIRLHISIPKHGMPAPSGNAEHCKIVNRKHTSLWTAHGPWVSVLTSRTSTHRHRSHRSGNGNWKWRKSMWEQDEEEKRNQQGESLLKKDEKYYHWEGQSVWAWWNKVGFINHHLLPNADQIWFWWRYIKAAFHFW